MFFYNLNVFIACLLVGGMTLASPIGMFISIALSSFIGSKNMTWLGIGSYLGYLVLAAIRAIY